MQRLCFLVIAFSICSPSLAQSLPPASDPRAVSLAVQAALALTGGRAVNDATLSGTAIKTTGSDYQTGTVTLTSRGFGQSRMDLTFPGGNRSDIRNDAVVPQGEWIDASGTAHPYALHNCWNDANWFFPALSLLGQTANSSVVLSYIGPEVHDGLSVQHISAYKYLQSPDPSQTALIERLSATDFYLDPSSGLPLAIVFTWHFDDDFNVNIPVEIRFANYQTTNGAAVPLRIQQLMNGSLLLDLTVTNVSLNTGLSPSDFNLQ